MSELLSTFDPAEQYDVVIVGLGPTGAVAAALLGQAGLRVGVIEKSASVYPLPRAIALDHEAMRTLQAIGLAEAVLPHTAPFTASEHYGADGQLIRQLDMIAPPYPMGWTPSMVFAQPPVERLLRQRLRDLPTVTATLTSELVDLIQNPSSVLLTLQDRAGERSQINARYVIGCDGASSSVRRLIGTDLEDLSFDEPWLVVDVLANKSSLAKLPRCSAQYCEPTRPISYIIGTENHRRWEIMLLPGEDPIVMCDERNVWALLSRWIAPSDGTLWRKAAYRFHALVARTWRTGRVFLAGDAAHQQPPFLGQGMCQGLRDVANLTWKLEAVLREEADERVLDTYEQERAAHVRALTSTIMGIGRYICERDEQAAAKRDASLLAKVFGAVKPEPRQDLIPKLSSGLLSESTHAAVGTLFPQPFLIVNGHIKRMDDLIARGWRIVLNESAALWALSLSVTEDAFKAIPYVLIRRRDASVYVGAHRMYIEQDGIVSDWFEHNRCSATIVRPDHYVYAVCVDQDSLCNEVLALQRRLQRPALENLCEVPVWAELGT